jgi:hypothetical protein
MEFLLSDQNSSGWSLFQPPAMMPLKMPHDLGNVFTGDASE